MSIEYTIMFIVGFAACVLSILTGGVVYLLWRWITGTIEVDEHEHFDKRAG